MPVALPDSSRLSMIMRITSGWIWMIFRRLLNKLKVEEVGQPKRDDDREMLIMEDERPRGSVTGHRGSRRGLLPHRP